MDTSHDRSRSAIALGTARTLYAADAEVHNFVSSRGADGMRLVLWGCVAALISILAVSALFVSLHFQYQAPGAEGGDETLHRLLNRSARSSMRTTMGRPASKANSQEVASQLISSPEISSSSVPRPGPGSSTPVPGLPLCPLLIVPDGTRLACIVQNDVRRRRQELSFDIGAVPARGGAPLFRVRVSELGSEAPGIYVETLSGHEQLAVLSTEDLWKGSANPVLNILRPWGLPYGTIQKGENGEYVVMRGKSKLLVFAGNFQVHSIQVMNASESTVATAVQTSPDEYQVHMQARTDAGLVILGLLAIDKCEITSDPVRRVNSAMPTEEFGLA